ncbi:glycine zipper 2TM domain-containing protein [Roseobacter sp. YSTF-M11]|uniref:17 kDa surface antigen n=1 Tax=Roseobacter insulae TaxID=2859783 RepID=A0A9X1K070_9RHOB|nr:RT0821/Lpp0805 family surface protein [Roseobacter insulae]MBW4706198.1 glycine zipper 2TM domain-containing protein [Roseobacter insulae]
MTLFRGAILALSFMSFGGCTPDDYGPRQTTGGLTGAVLGGLLGAQFGQGDGRLAATGAGVLIGTLIGSEIGRSMDDTDRLRANAAITRAYRADLGETIRWNNPNSGNYGTVVALRDGTSTAGRYCREYRQTITIGGRRAVGTGIACRQPDGTWQIVS